MMQMNLRAIVPSTYVLPTLIALVFGVSMLFGHPGQLDKSGGHHNHETGAYHFHTEIQQEHQHNSTYKPPATRTETQIMILQAALKYLGYYSGEVTGREDSKTTHALKAFQLSNNLVVTGFINDDTKHLLYETLKKKPLNY